MPKQMTLGTVLQELGAQNLVPPNTQSHIINTLTQETQQSPWFVNALVGISAWFAMVPFIVFLAMMDIIDSSESMMLVGLVLIVGTTIVQYIQKNGVFVEQLSLALNLTGQILLIAGILLAKSLEAAAMMTWFLEIFLIAVYRNNILRFLAILMAATAALILLYQFDIYAGVHVLIVLIAASAIWYWIGEPQHLTDKMMHQVYQPLGYGCVIALQLVLILSILPHSQFIPPQTWWLSTIGLTGLLLALEHHILSQNDIQNVSKTSISIFAGTLFIAILLHQAPGIIASIIILFLGFQRGNRVLMGIAIIFMCVFFIAYYYHLNISLLMKSSTLMTAGLGMLAVRFIFKRV